MRIDKYIRENHGTCELLWAPADVQLDEDAYTMVQPDIFVLCNPKKVTERCIVGAPDFIIEILSASSRKKDTIIKLAKYRGAGVREYWMIDIEKKKVITYFFEDGDAPVIYGAGDEVPVRIYDGNLIIDFAEIFAEVRREHI